ncbi:peroxisomal membrane protein PEX14-like isoform X1 [Typha latifolia]|uniref:peroxisomal membrane protein PEX14-like isoform X1 n=1 Tax=Typha latifolia TaxID=4733 RepID=UPI003C2D168B
MATQSTASPIQNPQNPEGDKRDVDMKAVSESSEKPVFANPEPMREDQIQNAVKFLSHPKVRGSPIIHRRSFLENKGLTKEEIDEAFRRVPDPPSNVTSVEAAVKSQASQPKQSISTQPQTSVHAPQPAGAPSSGVPMIPRTLMSKLHWYHALLAIGVLSASGAGTAVLFKNIFVPRVKAWIRKTVAEGKKSEEAKPSSRLNEEAAEAAKAAASAAAVVAKASQELISTKHEERKYFEAFMGALDVQVKEMKSMSDAIRKLESRREDSFSQNNLIEEHVQSTARNGPVSNPWNSSRVMATGQTGEKSPGMKIQPWEVAQQMQKRPTYATQSQSSDENLTSEAQDNYGALSQNSEPWWRKKVVKINETEPRVEEPRQFPYTTITNERPIQRGWVPPQSPPIAMPEAAAAIRHQKASIHKQQSGDVRSVASSDDGETGMQKASDSVVNEVEVSASTVMGRSYSEIQEERSDAIEVN